VPTETGLSLFGVLQQGRSGTVIAIIPSVAL
jgi:hypothetical protein